MTARYTRFMVLPMLCALILCFSPGPAIAGHSTTERIKERGVLLWGSDSEGGAPYVFPDPKDPTRLIGFELDIAEAVARRLGGSASGRSWCKQPGTA